MDASPGPEEPKPRGGFEIWFAGALVATGGFLFLTWQSRRAPAPADDDPRGRRAGLVAAAAPVRSSLTTPYLEREEGSALTPQEPLALQPPLRPPSPPEELQGSPGEVFSRTLASHADFYAAMARKHAESGAVMRFFSDFGRAPELARLASDYRRDRDAIKFARAAVASERFAALVKKYTLEPEIRAYAMELIMGSPRDVVLAWTNYAAKDPEGTRIQQAFFRDMGVPPQLAQIVGDGSADSSQIAAQVQSMMPAVIGGLDPKLLLKAQQQAQPQAPQGQNKR